MRVIFDRIIHQQFFTICTCVCDVFCMHIRMTLAHAVAMLRCACVNTCRLSGALWGSSAHGSKQLYRALMAAERRC